MSRFSVSEVSIRFGDGEEGWLETPFTYKTHVNAPPKFALKSSQIGVLLGDYRVLQINPFFTDLGSFPWWIQWRLKKFDKYNLATIVHDYMLEHRDEFPDYSRRDIDKVFREAMLDLGVPKYEVYLIYQGVRFRTWRLTGE